MIDQADRIESLFAAALQKPSPEERAAYLNQACAATLGQRATQTFPEP